MSDINVPELINELKTTDWPDLSGLYIAWADKYRQCRKDLLDVELAIEKARKEPIAVLDELKRGKNQLEVDSKFLKSILIAIQMKNTCEHEFFIEWAENQEANGQEEETGHTCEVCPECSKGH